MCCDTVGLPVRVDRDGLDIRRHQVIQRVIEQRSSPSFTSGLAEVSVNGRMRVPKPAARTMAEWGRKSWFESRGCRVSRAVSSGSRRGREVRRRLAQRVIQQPPCPRPVGEVLRAAVAHGKSYPLAGDAQMALRRTGGVGGAECVRSSSGETPDSAPERVLRLQRMSRAHPAAAKPGRRPDGRARRPGSR